ncbi:MAG: tetratricopeptide repeat protein [Phycisphaerales bacterium]|jgi:predicted O-linked N-acetylglucosamine transferase (SPINDLY family)
MDALQRAMQLAREGRPNEAVAALRMQVRIRPRDDHAVSALGLMLRRAGEPAQGLQQLRRACELAPDNPLHWLNLAGSQFADGATAEARTCFERAVAMAPGHPGGWMGMASCHLQAGEVDEAIAASARGLELGPDVGMHVNTRVTVLVRAGRRDEAMDLLESFVARHPADAAMRSELLMGLQYLEREPAAVARAHRAFGEHLPRPDPPRFTRRPGEPLRVGLLSSDLRGHSVGFFVQSLAMHAPAGMELVAFSGAPKAWSDGVTERIRAHCGRWHEVGAMDDATLDALIRTERIDVLLELAGHTTGHRLAAIARKPAPVIVTAIGYPDTTGLPAIDARLVDSMTDPAGTEDRCTERLVRIDPCFLCYTPPEEAPEPRMPAPDAPITFGSFNNASKIGARTARLWSGVLAAVPGSRLLLKSAGLADRVTRGVLLQALAAAGIDPARVETLDLAAGRRDHLDAYARVHVALDTTPYNGTTTTCEALWMGVPVVTTLGDRHAARVSASLLHAAGFPSWVARNEADFAHVAADLASDRSRLATLRASMRERLRGSALMDGPAYAQRMLAALENLRAGTCAR